MPRSLVVVALLMTLALMAVPVAAHAPEFPSGNDSLDKAMVVHDPTKSWAIYSQLPEGGGAHYYLLEMKEGENITVSLTIPRSSADLGFRPSVALMGPSIGGNGTVSSSVEVPEGAGVTVLSGQLPDRLEYEPFSPSAFYMVAELSLDAPVDGDYYLAVYGDTGGSYGLAVGLRESFTLEEWLLIPFSVLSIYQWEGQGLGLIIAPPAVAFVAGLAIMVAGSRRRLLPVDLLWSLATLAGLLMIASGASLLYQMLWALSQTGVEVTMVVTLLFAILPLGLGVAALRVAHHERTVEGVRARTRTALVAIGVLGLVLWAGWLVGPAVAILAAVLPARWLLRRLAGGRRVR